MTKSDKGGRGVKPNGDVTVYQFQRKMYRKIIHVNYDIFANLELFTLADNCIRGFKHIKHCFCAFLLSFCVTLAFVCGQLDTGLEILQVLLGQKVCHYLGGDKGGRGVKANGDKR